MTKISQFSNIFPYEGKYLGYNAFTNKFLVLEPLLGELILAAKAEGNIDDLKEIHENLYDVLVRDGFVVDNNVDEIQKVVELRESIDFDNSFYHLIINPTMNCNFKCWYCYEEHIKASKMDAKNIEKVKKLITNVLDNQATVKTFVISWFGGEPLLYYDQVIAPISNFAVEETQKRGVHFSSNFTSNGYLIKESMLEDFQKWNVENLQITLDGNKDSHDKVRFVNSKKGSFTEIVKNIKLLSENGISITTRINYTKENFDGVQSLAEEFEDLSEIGKSKMECSLHKVWQVDSVDQDVVNETLQHFRSKGIKASTNLTIDSVRNSCYADKRNHATINYNGDAFKCTARDFSKANREGVLTDNGEIIWSARFEERMNIKLKNKNCQTCSILPICNGGCSQYALENLEKGFCVFEDAGIQKKDVIIQKFSDLINA